jgi:tRNA A37 threonylcarbamoyladenosine dehydratase
MGAGGLGQSVSFALARMGVAKIILLDMDYFEATNLNRQILGTPRDVGRRKVDVAEVSISFRSASCVWMPSNAICLLPNRVD